jgi:hypothetical protein
MVLHGLGREPKSLGFPPLKRPSATLYPLRGEGTRAPARIFGSLCSRALAVLVAWAVISLSKLHRQRADQLLMNFTFPRQIASRCSPARAGRDCVAAPYKGAIRERESATRSNVHHPSPTHALQRSTEMAQNSNVQKLRCAHRQPRETTLLALIVHRRHTARFHARADSHVDGNG